MPLNNKFYIYAWNQNSEGAKSLIDKLKGKRIKHEKSKFKPRAGRVVINWGATGCPYPGALNKADKVSLVADKLKFFDHIFNMKEGKPNVPMHTTDKKTAAMWLGKKDAIVLCRTVLNGHGGQGIHLAKTPDEIRDAPLYVQYIPKKKEFRVHVVKGEVIYVQQKVTKNGEKPENWHIRNHDNGFIFQRNNIDVPKSVAEQAVLAVVSIGLDFGSVDIIWNQHNDKSYVLEINTAPGLEGQSIDDYAEAFKKAYG